MLLLIKLYIIFFLILVSFYISGAVLLYIFGFGKNESKKYYLLFSRLLLGFFVTILLFSLFKSVFITINSIILILVIPLIYQYYKTKIKISYVIDIRSGIKQILLLLLLAFPLFCFEYFFIRSNSDILRFNLPFIDYIYYGDISEMMRTTGLENKSILGNIYLKDFQGIVPYHYFELWTNAFVREFVTVPPAVSLIIFVYPLMYLLTLLGIFSICEIFVKINWWTIIAGYVLLFVGGVYFKFYEKTELLEWNGGLINQLLYLNAKKISVLYPFILFSFFHFIKKNYLIAFISLLFLAVLSSGALPGIIGGIFLFLLTNKLHNTLSGKQIKLIFIALATFALAYLLMYSLFGIKTGNGLSNETIINNVFDAIRIGFLKIIIGNFVYNLLRLLIVFSPFLLLILYTLYTNKLYCRKTLIKLGWLIFLIVGAGSLAGAMSFNLLSGSQFFYYQTPLLIIFAVICFIVLYKNIKQINDSGKRILPIFVLTIGLLFTCYNMTFTIKHHAESYEGIQKNYSTSYLEDITGFINANDINPFGCCFMSKEDMNIYPLNCYGTSGLGFAGSSVKLANKFCAVTNLSVCDSLNIDTTNKIEKYVLNSFEFSQFCKIPNQITKTVVENQLEFIDKFNINYIILYKHGILPEALKKRTKVLFTDKISGEQFVIITK